MKAKLILRNEIMTKLEFLTFTTINLKKTNNSEPNMRYEKQEIFLGKEAQKKIQSSKIVIVGLGALGSVVVDQLVRAGIKKIILIDRDIVEESNLQRQTLYDENDIHKMKAAVAKEKLSNVNSEIKIESHCENLGRKNLNLLDSDLVIDCTDNFETRFLMNEYCKKKKIPWIYGAVAGSQGCVFSTLENACFNCIFENVKPYATCNNFGIISPASNIVASLQVMEAFKILGKMYSESNNKLYVVDLWNRKFDSVVVKKNSKCKVCKGVYDLIDGKSKSKVKYEIRMCDTKNQYSARPLVEMKVDFARLKKSVKVLVESPIVLICNIDGVECLIHNYGEIFFRNTKNIKKMKIVADKVYRQSIDKF